MDLRGKTALVTGAASGIGRATALALANQEARLVLCDVNEEALREVEREVRGQCMLARKVDVSKRDAMRSLAGEVHDRVRAVDVLVNNAGVGLAGGILDTSLVNVSSVLGYFAAPQVIGYATTKFGVFGLSESLRAELAPHGIGVTTICPGVIATGIIGKTRFRGAKGQADGEAMRARVQKMYTRRNYGPEKVARAILHALEKDSPVVPVSPEAWALYYLKRFVPSLSAPLGRMLARHTTGG
jgi:NAD(P)-dependent dehydrogenase (short-subunit alcohol dehydrogenase family)